MIVSSEPRQDLGYGLQLIEDLASPFLLLGTKVEITSSYTYLGVKFFDPRFSTRPAMQPQVNKGLISLAMLDRHFFRHCLFREYRSLSTFFRYIDQRCLALYLQEAMRLRDHTL